MALLLRPTDAFLKTCRHVAHRIERGDGPGEGGGAAWTPHQALSGAGDGVQLFRRSAASPGADGSAAFIGGIVIRGHTVESVRALLLDAGPRESAWDPFVERSTLLEAATACVVRRVDVPASATLFNDVVSRVECPGRIAVGGALGPLGSLCLRALETSTLPVSRRITRVFRTWTTSGDDGAFILLERSTPHHGDFADKPWHAVHGTVQGSGWAVFPSPSTSTSTVGTSMTPSVLVLRVCAADLHGWIPLSLGSWLQSHMVVQRLCGLRACLSADVPPPVRAADEKQPYRTLHSSGTRLLPSGMLEYHHADVLRAQRQVHDSLAGERRVKRGRRTLDDGMETKNAAGSPSSKSGTIRAAATASTAASIEAGKKAQSTDDALMAVSPLSSPRARANSLTSIDLLHTPSLPKELWSDRSVLEHAVDPFLFMPQLLAKACAAFGPIERFKYTIAAFMAGLHSDVDQLLPQVATEGQSFKGKLRCRPRGARTTRTSSDRGDLRATDRASVDVQSSPPSTSVTTDTNTATLISAASPRSARTCASASEFPSVAFHVRCVHENPLLIGFRFQSRNSSASSTALSRSKSQGARLQPSILDPVVMTSRASTPSRTKSVDEPHSAAEHGGFRMKGRWRYDFTLSSDASAVFRRSGSCIVYFEDRDDPSNRSLDHHVEITSLPQTGPALVSDWSSEEVAAGRAEGRPIYWQGRMTFTDAKNLLFGEVELSGPGSELVGRVLYDGNLVSTIRGSWTAGIFFDKFACWTLGEFDPSVIDVRKRGGEWVRADDS